MRLVVMLTLAATLFAPARAAAQQCTEEPCGALDVTPPTITISPASATMPGGEITVEIDWSDDVRLDTRSIYIAFNGQDVTGTFTYLLQSGWQGRSTGVVTLQPGGNTLIAAIADAAGNPQTANASYTSTLTLPPPAPLPQRVDDRAQVSAGMVHPGNQVRRDLCLAVAVAQDAAYECGDLRLVHAASTLRVMNTPRSPVMLYNSETANPAPLLSFNLPMTAGNAPSAVTAILRVGPVHGALAERARRTWSDAAWGQGGLWRFAINYDASGDDTNVYVYQLEVLGTFGGSQSRMALYTGELTVVNRSSSPMGAGWAVAGVERLIYLNDGTRTLIIGGDGSTRVYRWIATNTQVAENVDRPDTLRGVYIDGQVHPYRSLPNGSVVWFDPSGRHYKTVTRLGHTTWFNYDNQGRLAHVTLPKPAGSAVDAQYVFGYDDQNGGRLVWICSIVTSTNCRNTTLEYGHGDRRVTRIVDWDNTSVRFGYEGTGRQVRTRTDRTGAVTSFSYDAAGKLAQASLPVPEMGHTATQSFTPAESRGYSAAVPASSAFTLLDGARTDVTDHTRVWTNRWGAPTRVQDALGHTTWFTRSDARFPAVVTRVDRPSGQVVSAGYDGRGNLEAQTDWSTWRTLGNSAVYATTRYERTDPAWPDFVTRVHVPEGESTRIGYHANGNRAWQQPGDDPARRVRFDYNALGLLEWITYPATGPQPETRERLEYDARGNLEYSTAPGGARTRFYNDYMGRVYRTESPIEGANVLVEEAAYYPNSDLVEYSRTTGPAMNGAPAQTLWVRNRYDAEGRVRFVERWSDPEGEPYYPVGTVVTEFRYDAAGRAIAEISPDGKMDSTYYDPAGNAVRVRSRRHAEIGGYVTMRYDALNRLIERVTPQVRYAPRTEGIPAWFSLPDPAENVPYPRHPNDGAGGYTIGSDVATFAYDEAGNDTSANNADARISRRYYPNGLLRSETQRIRTLTGADFSQHVYEIGYTYDLNGRRTEVRHPPQLAPAAGQTTLRYGYDPVTGGLASVTDLTGNRFTYAYNNAGQLSSRVFVGGATDELWYGADGMLSSFATYRHPWIALRNVSFTRDLAGRTLEAINLTGRRDSVSVRYSGLGHVVTSGAKVHGDATADPTWRGTERFSYDALGNLLTRYGFESLKTSNGRHESYTDRAAGYQLFVGRLDGSYTRSRVTTSDQSEVGRRDEQRYDDAGNVVFVTQPYAGGSCSTQTAADADCEDRAFFYDADGRLRAAEHRVRMGDDNNGYWRSTFEEYRYDALGRRVWVRSRVKCRTGLPPLQQGWPLVPCYSTVRRTVWDGDHELWEIQMPGADTSAYLENDVGAVPVQRFVNWFPQMGTEQFSTFPHGLYSWYDPNPFHGRVAYAHGLGVDQPLSVLRIGFNKYYPDEYPSTGGQAASFAPFTAAPLWDWRAQMDGAVFPGGADRHCQLFSGTSRCVSIAMRSGWHAYSTGAMPLQWQGTVVTGKADGTGTLYRRARYYDPATGRFTQEDPIGLAGGINLYGYAGGDPVNFVDPSGAIPVPLLFAIGGAVVGGAIGGYHHGWRGALVGAAAGGLAGGSAAVVGIRVGLLPATFGGARAAPVVHPLRVITSASEMGEVIGWGTGQTAAEVAKTQAVTQALTREAVRDMAARGLTREWVEAQLQFYTKAVLQGGRKLRNAQLLPRLELVRRILDLWP